MEESLIRISCASWCRVIIDGRYLLMLNHNRRQKGVYQLSSIGGALFVDSWDVLAEIDPQPDSPDSNDLRFLTNPSNIPEFRTWFYRRTQRELTPFREIQEELVEETRALPELTEADLGIQYLRTVEDTQQTIRRGFTGQMTHYFLEIFDVQFGSPDISQRLKTMSPNETGIVFLDEVATRAGLPITMEIDGAPRQVAVVAQYLFADSS